MDNLTHSLIGAAIGRAAARKPDPAVFWTAVISSNLPDIDVVFPSADRVSDLLHHRGYTHTLAFLPLTVSASALLGWIAGGRPKGKWKSILAVALAGIVVHIGADFWNDYGVHPFVPISRRWFYGDFIFIIEPLIWLALATWLFFQARSKWGRSLAGLLSIALLPIAWLSPYTGGSALWPVAFFITLFGAASAGLQWRFRKRERAAVATAWSLLVLILATFKTFSVLAESRVRAELSRQALGEKVTDVVLTPAPSNFLCWRVIPVSFGPGDAYHARMGTLSLWPALFDPSTCNARASIAARGEFRQVDLRDTSVISWKAAFAGDWAELVELTVRDCRLERFLGFLRVPVWSVEGETARLSDLRYSFGSGGFTEVELEPDPEVKCPRASYPIWDPPALRNR